MDGDPIIPDPERLEFNVQYHDGSTGLENWVDPWDFVKELSGVADVEGCWDDPSVWQCTVAAASMVPVAGKAVKGAKFLDEAADAVRARGAISSADEAVEYQGSHVGNTWTADLSHLTGKTAKSRNRAIDAMIQEDFPDLRFTHQPQYSPWVSTGLAKPNRGTQVGWKRFGSRDDLRTTLVHEELHHRWFARGVPGEHHPRDGSGNSARFYGTINRYKSMRGW
ncbi:hypothetical protein [Streptomyces sp. NPDC002346]